MKTSKLTQLILLFGILTYSCGEDLNTEKSNTNYNKTEKNIENPILDKGVGPITSVEKNKEINKELATHGKTVFETNCTACHKLDKRFIGPAITGVTNRRSPEWIMNMVLNPELMVKENDAAKQLLMEYMSPMANQNLTEDEARAVLEYFIEIDN